MSPKCESCSKRLSDVRFRPGMDADLCEKCYRELIEDDATEGSF